MLENGIRVFRSSHLEDFFLDLISCFISLLSNDVFALSVSSLVSSESVFILQTILTFDCLLPRH